MTGFPLSRPWRDTAILGDALLFIRDDADGSARARLLMEPSGPLRVESADRAIAFKEGRDYRRVHGEPRLLELMPGSRIPCLEGRALYPTPGAPRSMAHRAGDAGQHLLWSEGSWFHRLQCAASYETGEPWSGWTPYRQGPFTDSCREILRGSDPLVVAVFGDSISEGYNASGFTGAQPLQPAYPVLFAEAMGSLTRRQVILHNFAKAGWTSEMGAAHMAGAACEPDLSVIAFGMNDAGGLPVQRTHAAVSSMIASIRQRKPDSLVILVSPMLPNLEWQGKRIEDFQAIGSCLCSFQDGRTGVADCTGLFADILRRKGFLDVTGNGLNHPNDFGHRLYAAVLLSLFPDGSDL